MEYITLISRIEELVDKYGGIRPAAHELEIDPGYLKHLKDGAKSNPGEITLRKLGLKKPAKYQLL